MDDNTIALQKVEDAHPMTPASSYRRRAVQCLNACKNAFLHIIDQEEVKAWFCCLAVAAYQASCTPGWFQEDLFFEDDSMIERIIRYLTKNRYISASTVCDNLLGYLNFDERRFPLINVRFLDDDEKRKYVMQLMLRLNVSLREYSYRDIINVWKVNRNGYGLFDVRSPYSLCYLYDGTPLIKNHMILLTHYLVFVNKIGSDATPYILKMEEKIDLDGVCVVPSMLSYEKSTLGFIVRTCENLYTSEVILFIDETPGGTLIRFVNMFNESDDIGQYLVK
jgi:hypothetical protein